jgi:two-component system, OmpR family, sensor histidine kinase VicK
LKGSKTNSAVQGINTRVIYGTDRVIDAEANLFFKAKRKVDSCMALSRPPLAISLPQIKKAFLDARGRGVKLRYITEITADNLSYCKELLDIVDELKHLDGVENNFMISEGEYLAPLIVNKQQVIASELVYSNVAQVVSQGQYIFDTLWSKGISAAEKIKQIEEMKIAPVTEVIYGAEKTLEKGIKFMEKAKTKMDIFFDSKAPSIIIEIEAYKRAYVDLRRRGGKIRAFTDITKDNLPYCKELLQIVDELRHIDGIKGGIAITESEYMATTVMREAERLPQVIYSSVREIVEQGQYIFDTLWNKGIPAIQRIRELEEGLPAEKTEVISGKEQILSTIIAWQYNIDKSWNLCGNSILPSFSMSERIRKGYQDAKKRGVEIRYITEVTSDNLAYCKDIMNFAEVRHLDGLLGNFGVSEKEYLGEAGGKEFFTHLIYSNKKEIVDQQRYIFENLWNNAVPALRKIKEIEEGIVPYETKIIDNEEEIVKQIIHLADVSTGLSIVSSYGGMQLIYDKFFDVYKKVLEKHSRGEGRGIRWVMTIDKENVDLVTKFLKLGMKIRHVKNLIPINFAVGDSELNATMSTMVGGKMVENLLTSNEPVYVRLFSSMFDQLWKDGLDADFRLKDLEDETNPAEIELIQNPIQAIDRSWDLATTARKEVNLMFASLNAFKRQIEMGAFRLLKELTDLYNVKIRMIVPASDEIGELVGKAKLIVPKIDVRVIDSSLATKLTILLIDQKECLILEVKDDAHVSSYGAVGISTYSKSQSIVSSYSSIFESFWRQAELFEKMREIENLEKDFINLAAHELRTPIQPIVGFSELLSDKIKDPEQRKLLEAVINNAKRLEKLAEIMLDVARIEKHSLILRKETFDLGRIIQDIVVQYNERVKRNHIEQLKGDGKGESKVKVSILFRPDSNMKVFADKVRMIQVISNLLDNALKFTSSGLIYVNATRANINGTEKEEVEGSTPYLLISIKDEGEGINAELLPRLFTKFISKSEIGTGLGLFICKGIVEAHGGKMWAKNNSDGAGATFSFSIPTLND